MSDTPHHEPERRPHTPPMADPYIASGRTFSLRHSGLLALDHGVAHDIEALEESAFLLTIAWPGKG